MNYKETLFFIGKCLTINHEEHNKILIEEQLKSDNVNWDNVVKVSTTHYVFPALYCNLKRADFLHYVPDDLVEYMQHITNLNRERNKQIIEQAKDVNRLLLANNITPIFLKGTAFLLQGLYEDIAERMVGDIDFLVSNNEFNKTVNLLKKNSYSKIHKKKFDTTITNRHYPKMSSESEIASVEVHYKMVSRKRFGEFNYDFVISELKQINFVKTLSKEHHILMTCLNRQANDNNGLYKRFSFRASYDLFLLSQSTNPKNSITLLKNYTTLNNLLHSSSILLGNPKTIEFFNTKSSKKYTQEQIKLISDTKKSKRHQKRVRLFLLWKSRVNILLKSIVNKKYRKYLIDRVKSNF